VAVICNKCSDGPGIFHRSYSGEYLCRKCFLRSIEEKASKTISKYSMIRRGDRVAVGVSGGKDSLSLLYVLKKILHRQDSNVEIVAVTIDEGIEGYRDESLRIVEEFCTQIGVESHVLGYKNLFGLDMDETMAKRPSEKMTSCSMCGTFRRRAIDLAAEQVGADVIATAHNLDDQVQTFMINLLAGDAERIGWIYPQPVEYGNGIRKIKPFIEIYEYEIAFYALQRDLPFQSEECPYMNESIRSELRTFFNGLEKEHPGIKYNAYNTMLKISKAMLQSAQVRTGRICVSCGRDSTAETCSVCRLVGVLSSNKQI
jgi:uncharacterized protein (TIGR00269 family)